VSFFSPFLGLEQAFGTGFTSGSIADAILVAEQNESSVFDFGVFAVDGVNVGTLFYDVFQGLFLISDPLSGQILHQGANTQALFDSVERSRLLGLVGPPGPPGLPGPGVDLAQTIQAIRNIVTQISGARTPTTGRAVPTGLGELVLPGGTVNQPVVLGSTGDPTGQRRPDFPDDRQKEVEIARQVGLLIRQILAARAQKRAAERAAEKNAAFLAWVRSLQGGQQMPFGQSGFAAGALLPTVGSFLGNVGADILAGLISPGQPQAQLPGLPAFPQGAIGPTASGIPLGGGGACPPLFRGGGTSVRMSPVPWFPIQGPNGKWFFFGHLGTPKFSKLKSPRRHHHHARKR